MDLKELNQYFYASIKILFKFPHALHPGICLKPANAHQSTVGIPYE